MLENGARTYYIVREHPLRIIGKCRNHSKGTLRSFLAGICVVYIMMNWIPSIISIFVPVTNIDLFMRMQDMDPVTLASMPRIPVVIYLYSVFFSGVFNLGLCLYCLTYVRNRNTDLHAVAEAFQYYLKTLAVFVVQMLITAFWMMFLFIPGIIAALNYSQSFYILADDPDKGVMEVLAESKLMMRGNRMSYVRLLLYYFPYVIAAYLPVLLFTEVIARLDISGTAMSLISLLADIPLFLALGYVALGRTVFYELMINQGFAYFRYAGQEAFRELETDVR